VRKIVLYIVNAEDPLNPVTVVLGVFIGLHVANWKIRAACLRVFFTPEAPQ